MNKTREKCAWQILVKYYIILTHEELDICNGTVILSE